MKTSIFSTIATVILCVFSSTHAQNKIADEKIAPIARTCINCHGSAKNPAPFIPILHGQKADYLLQRLKDFRAADAKNHATVMPRLLGDLNDEQLQALAHWLEKNP